MKIIVIMVVLITVAFVIGVFFGGRYIFKLADKALKEQQKQKDRSDSYYEVLNQWLALKYHGISLDKYFVDNGYKTVAIYGFAEIGRRLYEELEKSKYVKVNYVIDQNAGNVSAKVPAYCPSADLENVDVIVITPTFAYFAIEKNLKKYVPYKIISIEDVVYDIDM